MSYHFQNQAFQLILHPEKSTWEVQSQIGHGALLKNASMNLHYSCGHDHIWALEHWLHAQVEETKKIISSQGPSSQVAVQLGPDNHQVEFRLFFALPEKEPLLMWKVQAKNHSTKPIHINQIELLNIGFINISHTTQGFSLRHTMSQRDRSQRGTLDLSGNRSTKASRGLSDLAFFSNGWQSWSPTGIYRPKDKYQPTRLGFFRQAMIENPSTSRPKRRGLFRSDMFGIIGDCESRNGLLIGFLSQKKQFGSLEAYLDPLNPSIRLWASGDGVQVDPGEMIETDWACLHHFQLDTPDPLEPYLEAVARENGLSSHINKPSPSGWCSWYFFSSKDYTGTVSPQAVHENTLAATHLKPELPLEIIQIDDGFEQTVGDWFALKPDFSQGIASLSTQIRQEGMKPGLWLAPFIVHPKSKLYTQHPDWLLRNRFSRPVNAGFCWNAFTTALDLTHPDAIDYCQQVIHKAVHEWGYEYLKLDFLYAAALPGRYHDSKKTRAQVLRSGLDALRTAAGSETTLLGCGCPLGSAIGLVDNMRIGTDTSQNWYPSFQGIRTYFDLDRSMPSACYSIQNAITRAPMHKRWWINDPDCLLVRPDSNLTLDEVKLLASVIALTGGSLFLSDNLPQLTSDRLQIVQVLLPLIDKRPYILDWFDQPTPSLIQLDLSGALGSWSLLAILNWQDKPVNKILHLNQTYLNPDDKYLAREFWSGKLYHVYDGKLPLPEIPSHGICLLAFRPYQTRHPIYIGSNLHISQGLEVSEWKVSSTEVSLRIDRPGQVQGVIDLYLPKPAQQIICDNENLLIEASSENYYRLETKFDQSTQIIFHL